MKNCVALCLTFVLLLSCDCNVYHHVTGSYYLSGRDCPESEPTLYFELPSGDHIGVVPEWVVAIAADEDFIVAKNKAESYRGSKQYVTSYYIVPISDPISKWPDENVYGPMTLKEYHKKRNELKVPPNLQLQPLYHVD